MGRHSPQQLAVPATGSTRKAARVAVLMIGMLGAVPSLLQAQQSCPNPVALFQSVQNNVQLISISTPPRVAVRQVEVCAGDVIRVGDNSRAVIVILASNTPLAIDQNTEFVVGPTAQAGCEPTNPSSTILRLLRGALFYISRFQRLTMICTPFVNASIEGTEFVIRVGADRTEVAVFEGLVRAANEFGDLFIRPGQQAVAVRGQAPQLQVFVPSRRDAVQWALYYEPILPADSLDQLAQVPQGSRDAVFYVRRAALLIAAGQLVPARSDLDEAFRLDQSNSDVHALRAIVAVGLNDKNGALEHGRLAVARAGASPASALIAQLGTRFKRISSSKRHATPWTMRSPGSPTAARRGRGWRSCA